MSGTLTFTPELADPAVAVGELWVAGVGPHAAPPFDGAVVTERVQSSAPPPQLTEQPALASHSVISQSIGHLESLHHA